MMIYRRRARITRKKTTQPQPLQPAPALPVTAPAATPHGAILQMQRAIGNQAVLQMLRDGARPDDLQRAGGGGNPYGALELNDAEDVAADAPQPATGLATASPYPGRSEATDDVEADDQQAEADEDQANDWLNAPALDYDNKELKDYATKALNPEYGSEEFSSRALTQKVYDSLRDQTNTIMRGCAAMVRRLGEQEAERKFNVAVATQQLPDAGISFREYLNLTTVPPADARRFVYTRLMGWEESDCDKYLDADGNLMMSAVTYAKDEDARKGFEVTGGPTLMQNGEPFDTGDMFSKFMGSGFAIYVMDSEGKIYASQHKVGLFHHSSFLAGASVAAAGEMKVEGGQLKYITNKSGHYAPQREHLVQVLQELQSRGVDLSGVALTELSKGWASKAQYPGGAKKYLETYG